MFRTAIGALIIGGLPAPAPGHLPPNFDNAVLTVPSDEPKIEQLKLEVAKNTIHAVVSRYMSDYTSAVAAREGEKTPGIPVKQPSEKAFIEAGRNFERGLQNVEKKIKDLAPESKDDLRKFLTKMRTDLEAALKDEKDPQGQRIFSEKIGAIKEIEQILGKRTD